MTQLSQLVGRQLPRNPNLSVLKREAKSILGLHRRGKSACCGLLRRIHRFQGRNDEDILKSNVSLVDVQFALSMDYGFRSWKGLLRFLQHRKPRVAERVPAVTDISTGWMQLIPKRNSLHTATLP
jgi:hypothetical protein